MIFCKEHRLPENHNCPFDLRKSSNLEEIMSKTEVLYQDALDFMNKELTVHDIESKILERMEYLQANKDKRSGNDIRLRELKYLLDWISRDDDY